VPGTARAAPTRSGLKGTLGDPGALALLIANGLDLSGLPPMLGEPLGQECAVRCVAEKIDRCLTF
jgi:hypothetical protein